MLSIDRKEAVVLFLGDIFIYFISLWIALALRHLIIPTGALYFYHLQAFVVLFFVWTIIFYIAGLYEKQTLFFQDHLPSLITITEVINIFVAVLFFYLTPFFSITPKTVLLLYLVFSLALLLIWRLRISRLFIAHTKRSALLIGSGEELTQMQDEVNQNPRYPFHFVSILNLGSLVVDDLKQRILEEVKNNKVDTIVIDLKGEQSRQVVPELYKLLFSDVRFLNFHRVYEEIFDRVPPSLIGYSWFLENVSSSSRVAYDALKRLLDIFGAIVGGIISLIFYPFVILAIKLDDRGSIFIVQERVGKNNAPVHLLKFRTMAFDDKGEWNKEGKKNEVTRVGKFLRKSRLDELPQLWNVFTGEVSLIGPRPEFPEPVKEYEAKVPYYRVRHLVKPGLSGWAQTHHAEHPHHALDVKETQRKLSYDLYYVKNRSFFLDVKIVLQTIRILFSQSGR